MPVKPSLEITAMMFAIFCCLIFICGCAPISIRLKVRRGRIYPETRNCHINMYEKQMFIKFRVYYFRQFHGKMLAFTKRKV